MTEEAMQFLFDELHRHPVLSLATTGHLLARDKPHVTQAALIAPGGQPVLVVWVRWRWTYEWLTERRFLRVMAGTLKVYTEHMHGWMTPPRIVVGLIERRKEEA